MVKVYDDGDAISEHQSLKLWATVRRSAWAGSDSNRFKAHPSGMASLQLVMALVKFTGEYLKRA